MSKLKKSLLFVVYSGDCLNTFCCYSASVSSSSINWICFESDKVFVDSSSFSWIDSSFSSSKKLETWLLPLTEIISLTDDAQALSLSNYFILRFDCCFFIFPGAEYLNFFWIWNGTLPLMFIFFFAFNCNSSLWPPKINF